MDNQDWVPNSLFPSRNGYCRCQNGVPHTLPVKGLHHATSILCETRKTRCVSWQDLILPPKKKKKTKEPQANHIQHVSKACLAFELANYSRWGQVRMDVGHDKNNQD